MSTPFIGEIRLTPYTFNMRGWASCDGQVLPIAQHDALFALLGTTYGGDGRTTFALPNLQSRIPVGQSSANPIGFAAGSEQVTLRSTQMPAHSHPALAVAAAGTTTAPANAAWAGSPLQAYSASPGPLAALSPQAIGTAGGNQPHNNLMPYLSLNFQIALEGIFPSRS